MFWSTTHKALEDILTRLKLNESNNYKDATQEDFKEYCEKFEELKAAGKLNKKQLAYYTEVTEYYGKKLVGFTHKDQKPYWYTEKK